MSLALLHHPENAQTEEIGVPLPEDVGQFEEARVDENGEGELGEETGEADDRLALLAQPT